MARLSYILMDVLDDDSSEARTDQRIRLLDRVMRLKAKPGVVVVEASDADVDGGLYRPEDWRSEQIQDYAARTCQTACLAADCQTCVGAEPDEGRVAFVTERRFKPARPVRAASAAPLTKDADTLRRRAARPDAVDAVDAAGLCYICCDRPMDSVLLPCGHSGACYACAVENVARTGRAPAAAAPSTRSWSTTRRRGRTRTRRGRVVGPGPVERSKSRLDAPTNTRGMDGGGARRDVGPGTKHTTSAGAAAHRSWHGRAGAYLDRLAAHDAEREAR